MSRMSGVAAALVVAALALTGSAGAAARRCAKGQVHTTTGCRTPIVGGSFISSDRRIEAAAFTPQGGLLQWEPGVPPIFRPACEGPTPLYVIADPFQAEAVTVKTRNRFVGTTFAKVKEHAKGGIQSQEGGWRTRDVYVSAKGRVASANTITATVTILETRGFGPTTEDHPIYTSCATTFSFTLKRRR